MVCILAFPPDVSSNNVACLTHIHFRLFICRFWYLKLYALTDMREFDGLSDFVTSKRSPIEYEASAQHLVSKGHARDAMAFVPRYDAQRRADLYVECGD